MAFDRLKAALMKIRGTSDIGEVQEPGYADIDKRRLEEYADKAALSCTSLCRTFIKANMSARGINSDGLSDAIDKGVAFFWSKRGVVRFRLGPSYNPYPERSKAGGVWMVAASQDAGRVLGIAAKAQRAKRTIKRGLADARSLRAITQVHNGRSITREAINAAGVSVVPPKKFFEFTPAQQTAIKAHFRKNFMGLIKRHREGRG